MFCFLKYPEYYTFLFAQLCLKMDLSMEPCKDSFSPFQYFKEKSYFVYRKMGLTDEGIKYGIIAMWAKVHGLAAIASMRYVKKILNGKMFQIKHQLNDKFNTYGYGAYEMFNKNKMIAEQVRLPYLRK